MTCEQAMELLSPWLDGELDPEQRKALEAHLEICPACKALADTLLGLDEKVAGLQEPAPQSLKRGVLYKIDQATGKAKKPRSRWFGPGTAIGAAAAVLVLLVGLGVIPLQGRVTAPNSAIHDLNEFSYPETAVLDTVAREPEALSNNKGFYYLPNGSGKNGDSEIREDSPMPATEASPMLPAETRLPDWEAPESESLATRNGGGGEGYENLPAASSDRVLEACAELCAEEDAMVLVYTEFGFKSLLGLLEGDEPKLFALVEKLEPTERDGMLVLETDCGTALALHEWLLERLPKSPLVSADTAKAESSLRTRMEELDPGSGSLYRVITWSRAAAEPAWPAEWPEGWADRVRTEENWGLFFPSEDYTPNADNPAYLAFIN